MKKFLVFVFLVFLGSVVYAQQRITIMVPPFYPAGEVSLADRDAITSLFLSRLPATGAVTVVNAADLRQRMEYLKWEYGDWSNNEKKAQLNAGFNADYLIIGIISRLVGALRIDIMAEDLNTFAVIVSANVTLQDGVSPNGETSELARGMAQTITGGGSGGTIVRSASGAVPEGFAQAERGAFQADSVGITLQDGVNPNGETGEPARGTAQTITGGGTVVRSASGAVPEGFTQVERGAFQADSVGVTLQDGVDFNEKINELAQGIVQTMTSSRNGGTAVRPASGTIPEGFVRIEGGTFQMGSANGNNNEKPVRTVTVRGFSMSRHEVTQKEWTDVMGTTVRQQRDQAYSSWPLSAEGDNYPMYYVSWYEAVEYCNKRSIREGLTPAYRGSGTDIICDFTASGYRLPTEAEWEYAAKGGNRGVPAYEYSGGNNVGAVGWYADNSGRRAHPVGTKQPNSLGLYDMSGNVWEWCWDWYGNYGSGSQADPVGPASGVDRVIRGGSWINSVVYLRSSYRFSFHPGFRSIYWGFRLALP